MNTEFTRRDQQLLSEAYTQINEGVWDRAKATGAGLVGSASGLLGQATAAAKGAIAGATGNVAGVQAAQQQTQLAANQGQIAKLQSYKKTLTDKLTKFQTEVTTDMQKLGLNVAGIGDSPFGLLIKKLPSAFDNTIQVLSNPAAQGTPSAPAAPAQPPIKPVGTPGTLSGTLQA